MKSPLRIVGLLLLSISIALLASTFASTFLGEFNAPLAYTIHLDQLVASLAFFVIALVTLVIAHKKPNRPTNPTKSDPL
jgi:hypothetical protein